MSGQISRQRPPRRVSIRFAGRKLAEIGIVTIRGEPAAVGVTLTVSTTVDTKSRGGGFELFFRSRRMAEKVLKELRTCLHGVKQNEAKWWVPGRVDQAERTIRDCAHRIGVEVFEASQVEAAIVGMAQRIEAMIADMHRDPTLRDINAEYRTTRLRRLAEGGPKMPNYEVWLMDKLESSFQIGAVDLALFSRIIPDSSRT